MLLYQGNTLTAFSRQSASRLEFSLFIASEQEISAGHEISCNSLLSLLLDSCWVIISWDRHPSSSPLYVTLHFLVWGTFCFPDSMSHLEGLKSSSSNAKGSWLSSKSSNLASSDILKLLPKPKLLCEPLLFTGVPIFELLDISLHEPDVDELTLIFNKQASAMDVVAVSELDAVHPDRAVDNHRLLWDILKHFSGEVLSMLQDFLE